MCRMLGLVGPPSGAGLSSFQHLVSAPHALRRQAVHGQVLPDNPPGHHDSWGIGWFDGAGRVSLLRQVGSASDSAYFLFAVEAAGRTAQSAGPACTLIGHLRKAVCGAVTSENAHPVRVETEDGAPLLVAHNGWVKGELLQSLRDDLETAGRRAEAWADCDSVVLAAWVASRRTRARFWRDALADAVTELIARGERGDRRDAYTGLNVLVALPEGLAALRQFSRCGDYYTLWRRREPGGWVVASERTDDGVGWELLEPGVLTFFSADGAEPCGERVAPPIAEVKPL